MRWSIGLAGSWLVILSSASLAQAPDPVRWAAAVVPQRSADSSVVLLALTASIEPGWKVYSLTQASGGPFPLRIAAGGASVALAGSVSGPAPIVQEKSVFGVPVEVYDGQPRFVVPVRVDGKAVRSGAPLRVRYQACTETTCLPPRTAIVVAQLAGGR